MIHPPSSTRTPSRSALHHLIAPAGALTDDCDAPPPGTGLLPPGFHRAQPDPAADHPDDPALPGPDEIEARNRMNAAIDRYRMEERMTADQASHVDGVLASIDAALVEAAVPANASANDPQPDALAQPLPDLPMRPSPQPAAESAARPALTPAVAAPAAQPGGGDWWTKVYRDQNANLDTFTGTGPARTPASAQPAPAPSVPRPR